MLFTRSAVARSMSSRAMSTTARFSKEHIRSFFPTMPFRLDATLGEIHQGMWAGYKHRMIYPVLLWAGVCYHYLWNPYITEVEKEKVRARERKLKALEFHQD